jgi:hypothetical protein
MVQRLLWLELEIVWLVVSDDEIDDLDVYHLELHRS